MIFFFVRRFNDIDHLAPIIYKLCKEKKSVQVLCINPFYDIKNDLKLAYLKEKWGADIKYLFELNYSSKFNSFLSYVSKFRRLNINNKTLFGKLYLQFYYFICKNFYNSKYYNNEWAMTLFANAKFFIFDFLKKDIYISNVIFKTAKDLRIPTMAVPPGVTLWYKDLGTALNYSDYKFPDYDYLIMQHDIRKKLTVRIGGPVEKMHLLGVPRFCDEWIKILHSIVPKSISIDNSSDKLENLKVLYIDRPINYRINESLIIESIEKIFKLDFVTLIIKPHTRSNKLLFDSFNNFGNVSHIDSLELVRWADVVIGTTSSILLEAFVQNKVVLYPKYMHNITTTHEKMKSCWEVNSITELMDSLLQLKNNKTKKNYSKANSERLIERLIYADNRRKDVLNEYFNFIISKQKT